MKFVEFIDLADRVLALQSHAPHLLGRLCEAIAGIARPVDGAGSFVSHFDVAGLAFLSQPDSGRRDMAKGIAGARAFDEQFGFETIPVPPGVVWPEEFAAFLPAANFRLGTLAGAPWAVAVRLAGHLADLAGLSVNGLAQRDDALKACLALESALVLNRLTLELSVAGAEREAFLAGPGAQLLGIEHQVKLAIRHLEASPVQLDGARRCMRIAASEILAFPAA